MGKFKEMAIAIDEIENDAKKVLSSVAKFKASFATSEDDWNNYRDEEIARDEAEEAKVKEPTPEKVLTLDEVRKTLAGYSRDGKTAEVKAILTRYGYEKLSQVDPKDYAAILKDAEVLQ